MRHCIDGEDTDSGEDPAFIARRLVILAADIYNPNALLLFADTALRSVQSIGMPTRYFWGKWWCIWRHRRKSNSSYQTINKAMRLAEMTNRLYPPLA